MSTNGVAKRFFADGAYSFSRGEYERSVSDFSRAIEADPDFELAYLSRGVVHAKLEKVESAMEDFNRAIELDSENAKAYHFRGLAFMKLGDRERALQDFNRAIELNPRYGVAYYSRGTLRSELGDADEAGKDMMTAARLGEANLQSFADEHNMWRTKHDKVMAEMMGERERDWAVTPDLRSWLDG